MRRRIPARDKRRIEKVLGLLDSKWKEVPQMRFGEMLIEIGLIKEDLHTHKRLDVEVIDYLKKFKW
jgi:hypothetical protein